MSSTPLSRAYFLEPTYRLLLAPNSVDENVPGGVASIMSLDSRTRSAASIVGPQHPPLVTDALNRTFDARRRYPSRFLRGGPNARGAWYASADHATAIDEVAFHNTRIQRQSEMRRARRKFNVFKVLFRVPFVDLRAHRERLPRLHHKDPEDYLWAQEFGHYCRDECGDEGLLYQSVRRVGGINVCVFHRRSMPRSITHIGSIEMRWDEDGKPHIAPMRRRGSS